MTSEPKVNQKERKERIKIFSFHMSYTNYRHLGSGVLGKLMLL